MTDDRLKEIEKWWMTHWSESGGMVATPDAHVVSFELIGEVKRLRDVLRYMRNVTEEALEK